MQDKRKDIRSAALKLMVTYGFHGTPTSMIAKEAGVANGTLFHYYKTKDELIVALYIDIKAQMSASLQTTLKAENSLQVTLEQLVTKSLHWALDNPEAFRFIQQFHSSPFAAMVPSEIVAQQMQPYIHWIEDGIANKILKPISVALICILISSHIFGVFQFLTAQKHSEDTQNKIISEASTLIWDMIALRPIE